MRRFGDGELLTELRALGALCEVRSAARRAARLDLRVVLSTPALGEMTLREFLGRAPQVELAAAEAEVRRAQRLLRGRGRELAAERSVGQP